MFHVPAKPNTRFGPWPISRDPGGDSAAGIIQRSKHFGQISGRYSEPAQSSRASWTRTGQGRGYRLSRRPRKFLMIDIVAAWKAI
jgi:hypothetical protein